MSKFYGLAKPSESDCDKVHGFFNLQPAQPQLEHAGVFLLPRRFICHFAGQSWK
jgi:hypothetical protein